jgi:hypothetical protein
VADVVTDRLRRQVQPLSDLGGAQSGRQRRNALLGKRKKASATHRGGRGQVAEDLAYEARRPDDVAGYQFGA